MGNQLFAVFSVLIVVFNDPKSLSFFALHAPLQGLALALLTWGKLSFITISNQTIMASSGIMTLQPTSQPASKVAGLFRHQIWILYASFPLLIIGSLSVIYNKNINERPHFVSWHGVRILKHRLPLNLLTKSQTFGIIATVMAVVQVLIGGGSVWSGGKYFGGGARAKSVWKYHRYSHQLNLLKILIQSTSTDFLGTSYTL